MNSILEQIKDKSLNHKLSDSELDLLFLEFNNFIDTFKLSEYVQYSNKDLLDPVKEKKYNQVFKDLNFLSEVAYSLLEKKIKDSLKDATYVTNSINKKILEAQQIEKNSKLYFDYNWVNQVFDVGGVFKTPAKSVFSILSDWFPLEDKKNLFSYYLYLRYDKQTIKSIQAAYAYLKYSQ